MQKRDDKIVWPNYMMIELRNKYTKNTQKDQFPWKLTPSAVICPCQ